MRCFLVLLGLACLLALATSGPASCRGVTCAEDFECMTADFKAFCVMKWRETSCTALTHVKKAGGRRYAKKLCTSASDCDAWQACCDTQVEGRPGAKDTYVARCVNRQSYVPEKLA